VDEFISIEIQIIPTPFSLPLAEFILFGPPRTHYEIIMIIFFSHFLPEGD
jgi:hypothetical protein